MAKLCFFSNGIVILGIDMSVVSSLRKLPLLVDFNFLPIALLILNPQPDFDLR